MSQYKVYYDEVTFSAPPNVVLKSSRYKGGNVGKSHSVVRYNYCRREAAASNGQIGNAMSSYYYRSRHNRFVFPDPLPTLQHNRLISKLEGQLGASGQVGASVFAEGSESVKMAVNMLDRAANLVKGFKQKDIRRLKKAWNKPMRPTTAMRKAGGNWLEFSFGWKPLVDTVCQAIAATGADFPPVSVVARDRMRDTKIFIDRYDIGRSYATQFVKYGYKVKVENPNVWLLGRLDLINPGGWIWEAIPYSFFVDYFVNIGDMIHNLDAFAGLKLFDGYATYYHSWEDHRSNSDNPNDKYDSTGMYLYRDIPPTLNRILTLQTNPLTSSWRRGLNASSFLAQRLR